MSKLTIYLGNHDYMRLEPNELSKFMVEMRELFPEHIYMTWGTVSIWSNRYTLDHEHALKQGEVKDG